MWLMHIIVALKSSCIEQTTVLYILETEFARSMVEVDNVHVERSPSSLEQIHTFQDGAGVVIKQIFNCKCWSQMSWPKL